MRPIALASFFAMLFINAAAHGAPGNLADFADAWGKGNVTHWPPPAPPAALPTIAPPAPPTAPPPVATPVPPALQPGGDPTLASEQPPAAQQAGTPQDMQHTGQLPEGRMRDADDATPEGTPGANAQGGAPAEAPTGQNASSPAQPRPGVGSVNPSAKELWQFSAPKAK
ncbi:hypothetical protein [Desulfovibrio cuneatus]|uniref:hypothetical protein n=1 Tax=Desulfovibrio cuneatus TaxID=159728 RepID=UPI000428B0F2|nr:hypothetical protein [Desulfovibrio cuneatus]